MVLSSSRKVACLRIGAFLADRHYVGPVQTAPGIAQCIVRATPAYRNAKSRRHSKYNLLILGSFPADPAPQPPTISPGHQMNDAATLGALNGTLLFAGPGNLLPAIVAGILGLLIGSFLNVVIHRMPKMMQRESDNYVAQESGRPLPHMERYDLVLPRSACPHCGHQITALENIPVLSYLALGGKCSQCKAPISIRYPLVEALTGALSAFMIWHFGSGAAGMASLVFLWLLIAMTFIDADTKLLPDDLTLPLLWLGLLINLNGAFVPLREAVIGAAAGYLSLWSVYWLFKLATGKEGMGYGDFKLLAALGAWMGWTMLPLIILLSSIVGAVVGICLIAFTRRGRDNPIPFGPYLAAAGLIALIWGKMLVQSYLGFPL
jgi:leader peptidase (prepilin peptidase) / N-methyltransferase